MIPPGAQWVSPVLIAAPFAWAAFLVARDKYRKRLEDRARVAAVARQIRSAMFTAYADDVMEEIYLRVMAGTACDEGGER
jgi:hypothetical protein